ncbi:MAG: EAL domain-containing protein [Acidobacteriota bacterium]
MSPPSAADLAEATLEAIADGVIRVDVEGRVTYLNPSAERLTGWCTESAAGCVLDQVYRVYHESDGRPRRGLVARCLEQRQPISRPGLSTLRARDGVEHIVRDTASPLLDGDTLLGAVVVLRDLTRVRSLERQAAWAASHDPLTGLLHRQDFEIYLEAALESARDRRAEHALLFLAVTDLQMLNDTYGHIAGDELLRRVGDLLRDEIGERASVLGRVGGSDFTVLLENCSVAAALEIARCILHRLAALRFRWAGQTLEVEAAGGVARITASSESVRQVLKAADAASYRARKQGRHRVHLFDPSSDLAAERQTRLHWVQSLRQALAEDRFRLYHQRILSADGEGSLHEILVRLVDADGTLHRPGVFIPIAESHDLAVDIDRRVVSRALELLAHGALGDEAVSLNLSGRSLGDEVFLDELVAMVRTSSVDPSRLAFEITETQAVARLERAQPYLDSLRTLGCRLVLDDFGSGFSSYAYLRNLPIDMLKIDGALVRDIAGDPVAHAMVDSIHRIGQLMGLGTIAEWVESPEVESALHALGVDYLQGYLLHRPEPITLPGTA